LEKFIGFAQYYVDITYPLEEFQFIAAPIGLNVIAIVGA
jgi:hypothetical protein